ncbi:MAG: hypothetical protein JO291_16175 [Acidimicrobiia bacterium]|nr:hypothetical protein [Acidimicrobiia bacterium]
MVLVLAGVLAVVAAVRSTWSPCGLSVLSTVTPMAERGRGHRFWVTALWFVAGALLGGATLGAVAAVGAAAFGGLSTDAALVIGGAAALIGAVVDTGLLGVRPPFFKRQLDDAWLDRYRGWVYGLGFGWQIGVGFATYIMTTAVPVTLALAALSGRPAFAFGVGLLFGFVRGSAIVVSAPATSTAALAAIHRRFAALEAPVRQATVVALTAVGAVALGAGAPWALASALVAIAVVLGVLRVLSRPTTVAQELPR